ncbi:MAG: hypothetical protein KJO65_01050 [Gemmatimonadetes bacterium]|nr:hypothetical protein [Gemmatimonadota bacterium]
MTESQERLARLVAARHEPEDALDPVAELLPAIESGDIVLERDEMFGYLPSVLEALDIPVSSQTLVFSRTSLQVDMIAPWAPRAIYFNDDVYVGFTVDGLVLEIAAVDPDGGSVFYTLDQYEDEEIALRRDELTCKGCHATGITGGVSGVMVRSFLTDRMGNTVAPIEERPVDDRTPMERRFGGWYVTGSHSLPHAGNVRADELTHEIDQPSDFLEVFDVTAGGNRRTLEGSFDDSFYLTSGSDIVAQMVLAHQTRVHNLITLAAEAAEEASRDQELLRLSRGTEVDEDELPESTRARIDYAAQSLIRGMLFYRAAPIGQVEGTSSFTSDFVERGPFDPSGRSLRDFSLDGQLFEYPLSFLIYSDAWDALPTIVKEAAYRQMLEVLSGEDDPDFPLLDHQARSDILEILEATKPDFAAFVRGGAPAP